MKSTLKNICTTTLLSLSLATVGPLAFASGTLVEILASKSARYVLLETAEGQEISRGILGRTATRKSDLDEMATRLEARKMAQTKAELEERLTRVDDRFQATRNSDSRIWRLSSVDTQTLNNIAAEELKASIQGGRLRFQSVADDSRYATTQRNFSQAVRRQPPQIQESQLTTPATPSRKVLNFPPGSAPSEGRYATLSMHEEFAGEHLGRTIQGKPHQVTYLNDVEREKFKLIVRDGKVFDTDGNLFDSHASKLNPGQKQVTPNRAIFIMDEQGNLYASVHQEEGKFHHSSLSRGGPVSAAGEIFVENGVLRELNNVSGHYKPSPLYTNQALERFRELGVNIEIVRSVSRMDLWMEEQLSSQIGD